MTTATRRLRRASVAGFATIATLGGALALGGGTALATFSSAGGGSVSTSGGSLSPNASTSLGVTVTLPDRSKTGWTSGDFITLNLVNTGVATDVNTGASSSLAAVTITGTPVVTIGNSSLTASNFQATLKNGTAGYQDSILLFLGQTASDDTHSTTFTISGLTVNAGVARTPVSADLLATASTGTPFGSPASVTSRVSAAVTVAAATVTTSKVANAKPGATSVSLGTISVTDKVGGAFAAGGTYNLTLSGGTGVMWTTAPSSGGTPSVSVGSIVGPANVTVPFTVGSTASASGNVITFTGGVITMPSTNGSVTLTVTNSSGVAATATVAASTGTNRIGGSDRYYTAARLFDDQFGWDCATVVPKTCASGSVPDSVVIASGTNYPDALSANYLAGQLKTGVLLTDPNVLPSATQQAITRGGSNAVISTVYIIGGTAAVSQNVQNQLAALNVGGSSSNGALNVIRIGGADRYATNALVDEYNGNPSGGYTFVATGQNYADALAIGPLVYQGYPLVLTDPAALSSDQQTTLASLGNSNVIILGGTAAVSTAVETALTTAGYTVAYRIAGVDRTETAAAVAEFEYSGTLSATSSYSSITTTKFGNTTTNDNVVLIARGDNYADALAAGSYAGAGRDLTTGAAAQPKVILLAGGPSTLGAGIPDFLASSSVPNGTVGSVTAIGLTNAISPAVLTAAAQDVE